MSSLVPGSQAYQKWLNLSVVMRTIRGHPGISRTELAHRTGLTKSTVGNLVRELLSRRLLRERALESSSSGRPRVSLDLPEGSFLIAGLDLRPEGYWIRIHDLAGRVVHTRSRRIDAAAPGSVDHFRGLLRRALSDVTAGVETPREGTGLVGVGIALPATVDPFRGRILHSESFDLGNLAVREVIGSEPAVPVVIENDANALAWGALGRFQAVRRRNLLAVTARLPESWRTGGAHPSGAEGPPATPPAFNVGTGVVLNGSVYYGTGFTGGEFRSAAWREGDTGETSGRPWTVSRRRDSSAGHAGPGESSPAPLDQALGELFEGLSVLVSVLRPQRLVYAGDLVGLEGRIRGLLEGELAGSSIDPAVSACPVEPAEEGAYAVAAGAADMFAERLFSLPGVDTQRPEEIPRWEDFPDGLGAPAAPPEVPA